MREWIAYSVEDLPAVVVWLLEQAEGRRKWLLYGDMGAGKTTFTKAFCAHLGVEDTTSSPTFSIINDYQYADTEGVARVIHHMDLYRLRNLEEAMDIGIEDLLYDDSYCLIEWPQVIEPICPENVLKISFEISDNSARKIVILS